MGLAILSFGWVARFAYMLPIASGVGGHYDSIGQLILGFHFCLLDARIPSLTIVISSGVPIRP